MAEYKGVQIIFIDTSETEEIIEKAKKFIDNRFNTPIEVLSSKDNELCYSLMRKEFTESYKKNENPNEPVKIINVKNDNSKGEIFLIGDAINISQEKLEEIQKHLWYEPVYIVEEDGKQYIGN